MASLCTLHLLRIPFGAFRFIYTPRKNHSCSPTVYCHNIIRVVVTELLANISGIVVVHVALLLNIWRFPVCLFSEQKSPFLIGSQGSTGRVFRAGHLTFLWRPSHSPRSRSSFLVTLQARASPPPREIPPSPSLRHVDNYLSITQAKTSCCAERSVPHPAVREDSGE